MVTRIQTASAAASSGIVANIAIDFLSPVTAGNLIAIAIRTDSDVVLGITDSVGTTYQEAVANTGTSTRMFIWYGFVAASNSTNTVAVSFSAAGDFRWVYGAEYSGVESFDTAYSATGTGTADLTVGSIAAASGALLFGAASQANFATYTAGADFTLVEGSIGVNPQYFGGVEEYVPNAPLSGYTAHFTSSVTNDYTMVVAVFGGPPPEIHTTSIFGVDAHIRGLSRVQFLNLDGAERTLSDTDLQGSLLLGCNATFLELASPPAPVAGTARVWVEDDGSGKMRLMVQFPSGSAIEIAAET